MNTFNKAHPFTHTWRNQHWCALGSEPYRHCTPAKHRQPYAKWRKVTWRSTFDIAFSVKWLLRQILIYSLFKVMSRVGCSTASPHTSAPSLNYAHILKSPSPLQNSCSLPVKLTSTILYYALHRGYDIVQDSVLLVSDARIPQVRSPQSTQLKNIKIR